VAGLFGLASMIVLMVSVKEIRDLRSVHA
jgi:hypothetical protein